MLCSHIRVPSKTMDLSQDPRKYCLNAYVVPGPEGSESGNISSTNIGKNSLPPSGVGMTRVFIHFA